MSKSIPAAKSQDFVDISGVQNAIWATLLEFNFLFYLKRQVYVDITRTKSTWGDIIFKHKSNNEIVNKVGYISLKAG